MTDMVSARDLEAMTAPALEAERENERLRGRRDDAGWADFTDRVDNLCAAYLERRTRDYADKRTAVFDVFHALRAEVTLLTHKVITCGVAASHPDAGLSCRGAYAGKWDSPQADEVRKLRSRALAAEAEAKGLREALKSVIANDRTMYRRHEARPDGVKPGDFGGTIWLTPKEIARAALKGDDRSAASVLRRLGGEPPTADQQQDNLDRNLDALGTDR